MSLNSFEDLKRKLLEIKEMGFIETHRKGQTGIGKTLEDLLGIKENNIPGPNALGFIELKAIRKDTKCMLTLFTLTPFPPKINSHLVSKYGYLSPRGDKKILHTTVNGISFNTIKGENGFKVEVGIDKVNLIHFKDGVVAYWEEERLKKAFERKLKCLILIKVETKNKGKSEKFWFNEGYYLNGFSFENFKKLIKEGIILIDIRIGQYPDGRTHDHGTAFRVFFNKLDLCYQKREEIL
ncbi:MAG TPA: MvaI/BcnI family restriction endonuclease [bacterium]|nr:MvaI/BcnI family restriction endonuclease [bacterium]